MSFAHVFGAIQVNFGVREVNFGGLQAKKKDFYGVYPECIERLRNDTRWDRLDDVEA
jgi:hypothetical protein